MCSEKWLWTKCNTRFESDTSHRPACWWPKIVCGAACGGCCICWRSSLARLALFGHDSMTSLILRREHKFLLHLISMFASPWLASSCFGCDLSCISTFGGHTIFTPFLSFPLAIFPFSSFNVIIYLCSLFSSTKHWMQKKTWKREKKQSSENKHY